MSVKWNIERIELFFYNAGENRWEMFQESSRGAKEVLAGQPQSYFRAQLQKLLVTVREALTKINCDAINCPTVSQGIGAEIPVNLTKIEKEMRIAFQDYCKKALEAEGINDPGLIFALEKLKDNEETKIPASSVPNLLSALPFARDWDIFGWLHPMSTSKDRFRPEDFWWRFFIYRVGYCDREAGQPNGEDQPLDYDVFFQMVGSGASEVSDQGVTVRIDPDPRKEIPYFKFAKSPCRNSDLQPKMDDKEYALYQAYADVIDAIQSKISTEANRSSGEKLQKNIYYVVYPVIACGYYHFVQLKVAPSSTESLQQPSELLENCLQAFTTALPIGLYKYQILKESLRELLVQIRLSAFQHYVTAWMTDKREDILKSFNPDTMAVRCFCELAPHLNEMRAIETKDAVWAHVGNPTERCPIRQILNPWAEVSGGGNRNEDGKVVTIPLRNDPPLERQKYRVVSITEPAIDLWLFHNQPDDPFAEECFAGTNERRLEEQFDAVKQRMRRFWHAGRP